MEHSSVVALMECFNLSVLVQSGWFAKCFIESTLSEVKRQLKASLQLQMGRSLCARGNFAYSPI